MAWTTPRTWVTSEIVTAAKMNIHVRDNLSYRYSPPWAMRAHEGAASTNADLNIFFLPFDTVIGDTDDMTTGPEAVTIGLGPDGLYYFTFTTACALWPKTTGVYLVSLAFGFTSITAGDVQGGFILTGTAADYDTAVQWVTNETRIGTNWQTAISTIARETVLADDLFYLPIFAVEYPSTQGGIPPGYFPALPRFAAHWMGGI